MDGRQHTHVSMADAHPAVRIGLLGFIEAASDAGVVAAPGGREALDAIAAQLEARLAPLLGELLLERSEGSGVQVRATLSLLGGPSGHRESTRAKREVASAHDPLTLTATALQEGLGPAIGTQMRSASVMEPLSEREQEVLRLVATGLSNKELATRLFLSLGTVKQHLHHINGKLATTSRTHAVAPRARVRPSLNIHGQQPLASLSHLTEDTRMRRSQAEIECLVHENHKLVQYQVSRYLKRYTVRGLERDDLVSWGYLGLVKAARIWDPERGAFSTVACKAIDWMLQRAAEREGRSVRAVTLISLDELLSGEEPVGQQERLVDRLQADQHVERDHLEGEAQAAVRTAVTKLPPFECWLIERRFFEDVPVARLAAELGVSRQSLCERQPKALRRLRALLDDSVSASPA